MNKETQKRLRTAGIIGGLTLLAITSYSLYKSLTKESKPSTPTLKYTSKPITILLTESILSSNLPLNEILKKTKDIVLVVPPNLDLEDLDIDPTVLYKVIQCETNDGIWSIVKHLNSEVIFVVNDDLEEEIPKGLERYVGDIIELDQNFAVINEKIMSYIIS